jgi:Fur family ferric uptake transcriptional regulator
VEFIDPVIEERQGRVAEAHGFRLTDHSLVLHGICTDAQCVRRGRGR